MKKIIIPVAAVTIIGAGYFAFTQGLIPGLGAGSKVSSELKADIEAMKGTNIEQKLVDLVLNNKSFSGQMTPEQLAEVKSQAEKSMKEDVDVSLEYSGIKTSSGEGKGTVELTAPKLALKDLKGGQSGELVVQSVKISRAIDDAKHYFYQTAGDIELYADMGGQKTKIGSISQGVNDAEIKFNDDGEMTYSKGMAKDIKIVEGRGNTTLLSIADSSSEYSMQKLADNQVDMMAKINLAGMEPGDMVKMMFAIPKPLNISADFAFKGDDIQKFIEEKNKASMQEIANAMAAPEAQQPAPAQSPFGGDLKLNNFSFLIGEAGLATSADLKFDRANLEYIPTGEVVVNLKNLDEFVGIVKSMAPMMPPEEMDKGIAFAKELGETSGADVKFTIKLDGTQNVTVNGKSKEEIDAIHAKHYPPVEMGMGEMPPVEGMPAAEGIPPVADGGVAPVAPAAAPVQ